ncbi:zinc-binding dehydrogenase [Streptomyces sp. NPDC056323]|uniref:zinc-binding dehydrogenase n=1 Tax=unclassified Streptomyces TaxID=2593676 RepID=UPI0035DB8BB3
MTASHLSTGTYPIGPGDTAVVHAAAGGVGLLLTQMVKAHGGRVIGLVSREGKTPVAKEAGADHVLVHSGGGFEERIRELTGERGADVFCDGSGTGMFHFSQSALRPHGVHAYCGPFTAAPTLLPTDLPDSSLLTYPVVHHHVATREALLRRTGEVFRPGPGRAARPAHHRPLCPCIHAVLDRGTATGDAGRLRNAARGHTDRPGGWEPDQACLVATGVGAGGPGRAV